MHRDLKPDNIKVTRDGVVKVLDFGLAKAAEEPQDSYDPDNSPTVLTSQSCADTLMGTAPYMSPEQARSEPVDKRTDIWAFGCVLYEMLTGKALFQRKTASDTLAAILKEEPDWSRIPQSAQPLLRACLKKDPRQRLHDIGDAKLLLESAPEAPPARSAKWRWAMAGAIGVLLLGWLWSFLYRWTSVAPPVTRWTATIPIKGDVQAIALSPDGSYLAYYIAERGVGHGQIYLRRMDELESRPIGGPDSTPRALFFSPDSRWVGYYAQDELRKAPVAGGSSITISNAPGLWGASWGPENTIVFGGSPGSFGGLMRVSAVGGALQAVTKPEPRKDELYHDNPEFLPGGKAILFTIRTRSRATEIAALNLRTLQERVLVKDAYNPRYAPVGDLLFEQTGSVFAVPFDPERLEIKGPAIEIIPHVGFSPTAPYAFSKWGTLVYFRAFATARKGMLVWVDRRGTAEPIPVPAQAYSNPSLSPDGKDIAVDIGTESENWDIWICGIARHTLTRLTSGGINLSPIWTPDGERVTFSASGGAFRRGVIGLFSVPADLSAPPEKIYDSRLAVTPGSWLRDGSALVFYEGFPPRVDIWLLPGFTNGKPTGQHKPIPLVQTANPSFNDRPQLSPDGHWLAYSSNISGRHEIYVQPFPGPGGKLPISTDGGDSVRWAPSGRELFYRNGDRMIAVEVQTEPVFRAGTPRVLFEAAYGHPPPTFQPGIGYDVAPDGKHFLMVKPVEEDPSSPQLQVVENWFEELKREAGK